MEFRKKKNGTAEIGRREYVVSMRTSGFPTGMTALSGYREESFLMGSCTENYTAS